MSDIQPASFADLKKAWDYWRHDQDLTNGVTPNARAHRLEFLRGIEQIKTQAKADALRDAAGAIEKNQIMTQVGHLQPCNSCMVIHMDFLDYRADQMEEGE